MSQRQTGPIILAVVAGYAANAILVVATEQLLLPLIRDGRPPLYYFVAYLISHASTPWLAVTVLPNCPTISSS
jgi:hypothetical protein